MDSACWLWEKDPGLRNQVSEESSPHLLLGAQDQRLHGCGARSTPMWVHRNVFWQLSRGGNLHGSGMSHATTASPKLSFRAPWRMGDAVVGRGNVGWTTPKNGHPCSCQNCSQGPPAEKTGSRCLLNRPPCPPEDQIGHVTELNWRQNVRVYIFSMTWYFRMQTFHFE